MDRKMLDRMDQGTIPSPRNVWTIEKISRQNYAAVTYARYFEG